MVDFIGGNKGKRGASRRKLRLFAFLNVVQRHPAALNAVRGRYGLFGARMREMPIFHLAFLRAEILPLAFSVKLIAACRAFRLFGFLH